ncbi:MAG TPA: Nif3-like dinuclear metal center hexameric protein [Gemmatimonadaceae bacterium]|jgi:dinuclear metal center YbgI/SA1388 family protein|nr:MAG: Nif3-like dinuclear metal center hexameric protein [Gemmatimonadetes bacterium SCN 70-22]HMN07398.1 Nif3-like dinuclear metal center hexameric protein [Gemmatimonadaceae bacterium]
MPRAADIAAFLDERLESRAFPDYPGALNGLQLDHRGPVRRVAAAVDFSARTIDATIAAGANLLIVHHGMFWGGARHITGAAYERLHRLMHHDIAVYASHLPLDAHMTLGNNAQFARALALDPTERFGTYEGVAIGVAGTSDLPTADLVTRADRFAASLGGHARASWMEQGRRTRRWAVVTGAGAGAKEIRDAQARDIDTLIVGEGPHHTTVDAPEAGLVIIYAGHYATETLGVRALAETVGQHYSLPAEFLHLPTGS